MQRQGNFSGILVVAALLALSSAMVISGPIWAAVDAPQKGQIAEAYGKVPLDFIENRGQVDRQVKYYTRGSGYAFFFTPEGMTAALRPTTKEAKGTAVRLTPVGMRSDVVDALLGHRVGPPFYRRR